MKKTLLVLGVCAFSFSAMAKATPSQSIDQFCADRSSESFTKELLQSSSNLMAFANRGGMANGGVCWWHSRFQRSATYLTIYKPGNDYPSKAEAEKIIGKIRDGKEIITIGGFRNFSEFSSAYRAEIQRELEKWQKADGIARFNWVMGLKGSNVVEAPKFREMMDELYQYVEIEGNIAYQKLQIKGVTAHAWLVVNMKKTSRGYDLEVLDSNYPSQTMVYRYQDGMTNFNHTYYGAFTPYLERRAELDSVKMAILEKCNPAEYKLKKAAERNRVQDNNNNYGN